MKAYTDITILVDRSGSMLKIKEAMQEALRKLFREHWVVPSTRITLIEFDDINDQHVVFENRSINTRFLYELEPRGNTPLLDAMVKAIDATGRRLTNLRESDRPDQVLFVVITDGEENASKQYRRSDVFDRITLQREAYKWQFMYLGANQDVFAEARSFGIPTGTTMRYTTSPYFVGENSQFANYVTNSSVAYASRTASAVPDVTNEERLKAVQKSEQHLAIPDRQ